MRRGEVTTEGNAAMQHSRLRRRKVVKSHFSRSEALTLSSPGA